MLDDIEVGNYMKESEIDKAFPYLDELNTKLAALQKNATIDSPAKRKFHIFSFFKDTSDKKVDEMIATNTKYIKSKTYKKDGYQFLVRFNMKYNESTSKPCYYEVYINIKYSEEKRNKEFYRKFNDVNEAREYYDNWEGMLKHLTRRDIMERLFKEKLESIEQLSTKQS